MRIGTSLDACNALGKVNNLSREDQEIDAGWVLEVQRAGRFPSFPMPSLLSAAIHLSPETNNPSSTSRLQRHGPKQGAHGAGTQRRRARGCRATSTRYATGTSTSLGEELNKVEKAKPGLFKRDFSMINDD